MNAYEEKVQAKKDYYQQKADQFKQESEDVYNSASAKLGQIPFGQPIMGTRDRNFRNKQWAKMEKSSRLDDKAAYYQQKADSIGKGGISSDNPDAIKLLQEKIDKLEQSHLYMKASNKYVRMKDASKGNELLKKELHYCDLDIAKLRTPDFCGRIGFANYCLSSNRQEIARLKARIKELESRKIIEERTEEVETDLYKFIVSDNRCQFIFNGKPSEEIRTLLKSTGFKWSPTRSAWVRMASKSGMYASKSVMEALKTTEGGKNE